MKTAGPLQLPGAAAFPVQECDPDPQIHPANAGAFSPPKAHFGENLQLRRIQTDP